MPIMARNVTEVRTSAAPGGRDWPPWKQMWDDALARASLAKLKPPAVRVNLAKPAYAALTQKS